MSLILLYYFYYFQFAGALILIVFLYIQLVNYTKIDYRSNIQLIDNKINNSSLIKISSNK